MSSAANNTNCNCQEHNSSPAAALSPQQLTELSFHPYCFIPNTGFIFFSYEITADNFKHKRREFTTVKNHRRWKQGLTLWLFMDTSPDLHNSPVGRTFQQKRRIITSRPDAARTDWGGTEPTCNQTSNNNKSTCWQSEKQLTEQQNKKKKTKKTPGHTRPKSPNWNCEITINANSRVHIKGTYQSSTTSRFSLTFNEVH